MFDYSIQPFDITQMAVPQRMTADLAGPQRTAMPPIVVWRDTDSDPEYEQWAEAMDEALCEHEAILADMAEFRYINAFDEDASDPARHMFPDDSWFEQFGAILTEP